MDFNILPCLKTHYSLGRSILNCEKPKGNLIDYPTSVFDLIIQNKLDTLIVVEDSISGLLELSQNATSNKIKLIFGLRISICDDINYKETDYKKKTAKYIIFIKNSDGYKDLIKISSFTNCNGFFHIPRIDFKNLKHLWTKNLMLTIPFYDSFLHLNALESHSHVPKIDGFGDITFLKEENDLPFDFILENKVSNYCRVNNFETLPAQSIYYKDESDFLAYQTFRCIHSKGAIKKATLEAPELNHCCSNTFNFNRWLQNNQKGSQ